jgi:hypothetical protein
MHNFATALALLLATAATSAFAFDTSDMHQGRTMTQTAIKNAFAWLRVDGDPTSLTLIQIAKIEGVLSESDESDADKKQAIQQILREQ